jgi:hypothetical protein
MWGVAAAILQGAGGTVSVVKTDPRTGRLVRTVVRRQPAVRMALAVPSAPLIETVERIAEENQLSASLVHSVIQVESNYDANAVSPKGALGLMQLIPSTARRFGVLNVFDPADNIQGGARYLKHLLGLYKGDQALALAAYNAGEGAVSRYGGVPPFPETQGYVAKVQQRLAGALSGLSGLSVLSNDTKAATEAATKTAEAVPAEVYNAIREVTDASGKISYTSH